MKTLNKDFRVTIRFTLDEWDTLDHAYRLYLIGTKEKPLSFNAFLEDFLNSKCIEYISFMNNSGVFLNLSDKNFYKRKLKYEFR